MGLDQWENTAGQEVVRDIPDSPWQAEFRLDFDGMGQAPVCDRSL